MPEIVEIIAINGRTEDGDGVSRPFRCEDEEGREYFVKLKNAGFDCLVKEWVAGRLAQVMELPVAGLYQVRIPPELIEGKREYENDLGHGIAFGSLKVDFSERLSLEVISDNADSDLSRIHLFDWWVKNSDRALTEIGGNPNLLWQIDPGKVVMIDHDNAFDSDFNVNDFAKLHALRSSLEAWAPKEREKMTSWLEAGLAHLDKIWEEIPEEWLVDPQGDSRCGLDKPSLSAFLSSFKDDSQFWTPPNALP